MEGSYACNLNNRFELFLDEENDPLDILAKSAQDKRKPGDKKDTKKDAKKKGLSKTLVESVKTIAAAVETNAPAKPLGRRNVSPTQSRPAGQNRPPRGDGPEKRNNERNRPESGTGDDRSMRREGGGNRGPRQFNRDGPRGERGERYGGGERGAGRGRDFDRRSGDVKSGVKPVEKRGGQGSYNWGDPTENTEVAEQDVSQEAREENAEDKAPAEPTVIEMTLEQWKKEQAAKKSKASYAGNIRKPNEGEKDDPKMKKAVVIKKKKDVESDDAEDDDEESEDECEKMKKQLEQTLASQFHFAEKFGPPRGGRPGGPGGRPSGPPRAPGAAPGQAGGRRSSPPPNFRNTAPRQANKPQHTPRVEDLNDFPSLAA